MIRYEMETQAMKRMKRSVEQARAVAGDVSREKARRAMLGRSVAGGERLTETRLAMASYAGAGSGEIWQVRNS